MKRTTFLAISLAFACFFTQQSFAATIAFSDNLSLNGVQSAADVAALQQFLTDQGLYTGGITGNFFAKTYAGVIAFQTKEGIVPASGYWGPATRAKANQITSIAAIAPAAADSSDSIISDSTYQELLGELAAAWAQVQRIENLIAHYHSQTVTPAPPAAVTPPAPVSISNSVISTSSVSPAVTPSSPPVQKASPITITPAPTTSTAKSPSPSPAPISIQTSPSGIPWGAYTGDTLSDLSNLESLVGTTANLQAIFWGWDDTFPTTFNSLGAGKTLVVFWEPSFDYDHITDGEQDAYIASFAQGAEAYAKNHLLILVPFDEMNLGEEVWGDTGNNTPAKFVAAWQHVHNIFVQQGATDVKWGLAYNNVSTGPHTNFADYYPGSSYVDYVGVDGFNFGNPSQSPSSVFGSAITTIEGYGKPIYLFSVGTAEGSDKASWISAFGSYIKTIPNLQGFIWFNSNSDGNWLINSDPAALTAFTSII